jgi:hypothetical protein
MPDIAKPYWPKHVALFIVKICYFDWLKYSFIFIKAIFGPKRDEVTGEWRRLHNEELNDLYSSPNIIRVIKSRRMRWAGYVARMGEGRGAYRILVGRPEGRRPLGRPRRRWEDNIKMDIQEVGWGAWTGLIWLRIGTGGGLL